MNSIDDLPIAEQQALYTSVISRLPAGSEETFFRESLKKTSTYKTRNHNSYHLKLEEDIRAPAK